MANPGFRDLKPGMSYEDIIKICNSLKTSNSTMNIFPKGYSKCYGIDNIKFQAFGLNKLSMLSLDMGPIVQSDGSFFSKLNNLVVDSFEEPNIYLKMKKNFDTKYSLDYEYSERDRQLFNEGEKTELLGVYSNGQVALKITQKKQDSYSKVLWLYIEYRDVASAKKFLKKNRPIRATLDDF